MNIKRIRWSSDISFLIPVSSHNSIKVGDKYKMSYIKFSIIVKKRSINVHLNNKSSIYFLSFIFSIFRGMLGLLHDIIELIYLIDDCNTSTLICVLSWLDYPYISHFFAIIYFLFFLFFYYLLSFFIVLNKSFVLNIFETIFDVKSKWNVLKNISIFFFIIIQKVIK